MSSRTSNPFQNFRCHLRSPSPVALQLMRVDNKIASLLIANFLAETQAQVSIVACTLAGPGTKETARMNASADSKEDIVIRTA